MKCNYPIYRYAGEIGGTMSAEVATYNHNYFNNLPTIEDADAKMRSENKLELALSALGPIFVKYGLEKVFGISLLHKHWSIENAELPVTELIRAEAPNEFELRPRPQGSTAIVPSIMRVSNGNLEPVEFASDAHATHSFEELRSKPKFVREFSEALENNGLSDVFGLGVPRPTTGGFELVEFTLEDRRSISKEMRSADVKEMKVIETGWMFDGNAAGKCEKSCFAKCNVPGHSPSHSPAHKPGISAN